MSPRSRDTANPGGNPENQAARSPGKEEQVEQILREVSHEELKDLVRKLAIVDPTFFDTLLATFPVNDARETRADYARKIRDLVTDAIGRQGHLSRDRIRNVSFAVGQYLASANAFAEQGRFQSALAIATAVLEEMIRAREVSYSCEAEIEELVGEAFELLKHISRQPIPDTIRLSLLDYCFKAQGMPMNEEWGEQLEFLELAAPLIASDQEEERLFAFLDKELDSFGSRGRAQMIRYSVLLQRRGEAAAEEFLMGNLDNDRLRHEAIGRCVARKEYDRAIGLVREALANFSEIGSAGTHSWLEWLLKIARERQDKPAIVEHARSLYLGSPSQRESHYELLKETVKPEDWPAFVEDLISEIRQTKPYGARSILAGIHIAEAHWDRLMELLRKKPTLGNLDSYTPYLITLYREELVELYGKAIQEYLEHNMKRKDYQLACHYLQKLRTLGAGDKVDALVALFRQQYKSRPALMEELDKV